MHGRVKTRTTAEQQEAKRKEKEKKAKLYRTGIDQLFEKRQAKEYDEAALSLSGQLLAANPDITTVWNVRREILLHIRNKNECSEEELKQKFLNELQLTEQCLRVNPKSYGAWHHRRWVMTHMPEPNWKQELALCNKYLELDERNFHCWDYRRFVVEQSKVPAAVEFEYSTQKILKNFSNYSSWHYRSKLLPYIYPDPLGKLPIQEDKHKEELELVHNAAFTDPNDQSAWFYQRWLLGRTQQPLMIALAFVDHNMACITLTQSINVHEKEAQIEIIVNGQKLHLSWMSTSSHPYSNVWISPIKGLLPQDEKGIIIVSVCNESTILHSVTLQEKSSGTFQAGIQPQFGAGFSEGITSVLQCELDSCMQLLDLEPDSKWTLLTTVLLMQAIDRHKYEEDTFDKLSLLIKVDPHRSNYYSDLRSRYKLEYAIDGYKLFNTEINLSQLNLTSLYHCQYISCVQIVDLSNNNLTTRSLSQLHSLQCCKVLKLDNNMIVSLRGIPELTSLESLSLQNNQICSSDEIKFLNNCRNLVELNLTGNSVNELALLESVLSTVKLIF